MVFKNTLFGLVNSLAYLLTEICNSKVASEEKKTTFT